MVTWPSGKAKVCKTFIHQFKSGRHLHKTVMKKMSQSFFFVVASKIGDFANQFLNTVLQCCPTIFGWFAHPEAHFSCRFLEFGMGAVSYTHLKPSPSGEGDPAGPDEGRPCRRSTLPGSNGISAPHQSVVGATDSFPRGGSQSPVSYTHLCSRGCTSQGRSRRRLQPARP